DVFLADQDHVGRLHHGIGRFDRANQALGLDHAQCFGWHGANSNRLQEMRQYTIIGARLFLPMKRSCSPVSVRVACAVVVVSVAPLVACRHSEPPAPPVAAPSLTLNQARAPLGSPIDLTYKFVVASDAHFDQDYRVMAHVVDSDEEM